MAKRYTISLPDELAQRIEPFKDQLSLSAIMQKSLEAELAELLRPEGEKAKASSLLEKAKLFYKEDFSVLVKGASVFIDHLIDQAIQDSDLFVFRLYGILQAVSPEGIQMHYGNELFERLCKFCESASSEGVSPNPDWVEALWASVFTDQRNIEERFPDVRPWNDTDLMRILKIVLDERLHSLLGDEAIKTYLTWGTGYPDHIAELEEMIQNKEATPSSEPDQG